MSLFSFFTRRDRAAPTATLPTEADALADKTAAYTRQLAELRVRQAARQEYLTKREAPARPDERPGELWLHTPTGPTCALARSPHLSQAANNDNKLVLGPAGSGRSLMLGRLARAAYEAGNYVVMLNNSRTNYNNPGPLWMLNYAKGGSFRELNAPQQVRFNPFWLPASDGLTWRAPSPQERRGLAAVLASVLGLTRYAVPVAAGWAEQWLYEALGVYYLPGGPGTSDYPSLAAFAAWLASGPHLVVLDGAGLDFLDWFAQVSQPFVPGGALVDLFGARHYEVALLVYAPRRLLHLELVLDERAATEADTPGFADRPWPHKAAQAQTRALLLLLHTLDTFLGQGERRLTIVADELPYECLGERTAAYLDTYLRSWQYFNREVVVGWHEYPTTVFSDEHPAAKILLRASGTHLLLATSRASHGDVSSFTPLELSATEKAALVGLSQEEREVLIRRGGENYAVFSTALADVDLTDFYRKRFEKD